MMFTSDINPSKESLFNRINPLAIGVTQTLATDIAVPPAIPVPDQFWRRAAGGTPIDCNSVNWSAVCFLFRNEDRVPTRVSPLSSQTYGD